MKQPIKSYRTTLYQASGVGGHRTVVEAATPAASMEKFFRYLMERNGELEAPAFPGPKQSLHSSKVK